MLFSFVTILCPSFVDKTKRLKHFNLEREQWISFLETMFTQVVFFFSFFFLGLDVLQINSTTQSIPRKNKRKKTHNISIQLSLFFAEAPKGNWFGLWSKNSNNTVQQITELWLYGSKKTNWGADVWHSLWMHQSEQNGAGLWMYFFFVLFTLFSKQLCGCVPIG